MTVSEEHQRDVAELAHRLHVEEILPLEKGPRPYWLKNRPTLLLSMGFDSLCAWYLRDQPQAKFYFLGSCYSAHELVRYKRLQRLYPDAALMTPDFTMGRLAESEQGETAFVPLRNFMLTATTWAQGADEVILAAATDYGPDKRLLFTLSAGVAARIAMGSIRGRHVHGARGHLKVSRPFRWWTKAQLLRAVHEKTGSWDFLRLAYSCYRGEDPMCGECRCCRRAAIALAAAGAPVTAFPTFANLSLPRGIPLRRLLAIMPDAFDFGKVPALAEFMYYPLRTKMVFEAWQRTRDI